MHSFWDGGSELQAILVKQQTERIAYFFGREVVTSMVLAILVKQQMGGTSSEDGRVQKQSNGNLNHHSHSRVVQNKNERHKES